MLAVLDRGSEVELLFGTRHIDARSVAARSLEQVRDACAGRQSIDTGRLDRADDLDDDLAADGRAPRRPPCLTLIGGGLYARLAALQFQDVEAA